VRVSKCYYEEWERWTGRFTTDRIEIVSDPQEIAKVKMMLRRLPEDGMDDRRLHKGRRGD
jgi:hypothetical protein